MSAVTIARRAAASAAVWVGVLAVAALVVVFAVGCSPVEAIGTHSAASITHMGGPDAPADLTLSTDDIPSQQIGYATGGDLVVGYDRGDAFYARVSGEQLEAAGDPQGLLAGSANGYLFIDADMTARDVAMNPDGTFSIGEITASPSLTIASDTERVRLIVDQIIATSGDEREAKLEELRTLAELGSAAAEAVLPVLTRLLSP